MLHQRRASTWGSPFPSAHLSECGASPHGSPAPRPQPHLVAKRTWETHAERNGYSKSSGKESAPVGDTENRSEGRSNVFLTASLCVGRGAMPVRIRNLASGGALVEATGLPPVGTSVAVVRGSLSATGEVSWDGAGQAGINFAERIDVAAWVQKVGHAGQHRVDRVLAAIRSEALMPIGQHAPRLDSLSDISALLDGLCERLASMPELPIELSDALVTLDMIAEALRRRAPQPASR